MITSISINRRTKNYTTAPERADKGHAGGSQAGQEGLGVSRRRCQTLGDLMDSQELNSSGQGWIPNYTQPMPPKQTKTFNFVLKVLVNNLIP